MWEEHPDTAGSVIERHDAVIRQAVAETGGVLIKSKGEGDSTFSVFEDAGDAVTAAVKLQRALQREPWPEGGEVRVRAVLYTGTAEVRANDYNGIAPNRGGRLRAVAHGRQTICCHQTKELATVSGRLSPDVSLRDLGLHRLRDLARGERVFQILHPELPHAFPPLRSLGVRHNLPPPRTSFIGRQSDQVAIHKYLEAGRLVTLTGVGGCGKTRLAIEVASEGLEQFPDGVFFVELAPISEVTVLSAAVGESVGLSHLAFGTGSGDPTQELIEYLSTRDVLLVLDNCEHVVDACADLVDEILERCPTVSVLATSREVLELHGEQVYPVLPLGIDDDSSQHSESVQLFCARVLLVRPDWVMSAADSSDVAAICRRLDGLPLAIELAAARVAYLSPRQIFERLDDRFRLLAGSHRSAGRQQTLHAALDWSHDLLADHERVAFRRLAAFPGSFSYEDAEAVCDEPGAVDVLLSLVRKSLIVMEDTNSQRRFRLLETVRVYAEERLDEAGEDASVRDRHRDHFLFWAESISPELTYLDPDGSVRRERVQPPCRAWLVRVSRSARSRREDLEHDEPNLVQRHRRRPSLAFHRAGRARRPRSGTSGSRPAVAAQVAVLAMEAFDGQLARQAVEASDARPGIWSSLAHALLCLNNGLHGFWTKDPSYVTKVERLGRQAIDLATEPLSRGRQWFWLGQARILLGDLDGAIDALEKGSIESIPGGDMSPASLAMLAGTLHLKGRHDEALAAATEVFERAKSFQDSGLWAWTLYCSLPYPLELGQHGRHAEAAAFMRDLLEDSDIPRPPES